MPFEKIADFTVERLQVLDSKGNVDAGLEPKLSNEQLDAMYRTMALCRVFDRKSLSLQRQGRSYTYAPIEGQEASQIGAAFAMGKDDWGFPSYREHGVFISRGMPLHLLLLYTMGSEEGSRAPPGVNLFPIAVPVGSQALHAVGAAYAAKVKGKKTVAVAFFGDGATSEGEVMEAMNFAGAWHAPCVFVCQNNQYAISTPLKKQTAAQTIAQKAVAFGFHGIQVDGNDVLGVYKAVRGAIEKARAGGGPTLLELLTYRFGPHTTADDPSKYRSKEEEEKAREKDPLPRFQAYLKTKGVWNEAYEKEVQDHATAKVEEAVAKAEATPPQPLEDVFKYVYKDMPPFLQEQLAHLKQFHPAAPPTENQKPQ